MVTRKQLLAAGLGPDAIDHWMRRGLLRRLHRGVYLHGPIEPSHAREMAAVLACGAGTAVSHRDAARIQGLLPYPARPEPVSVIVARRNPGTKPGLIVHRVRRLPRDEVVFVEGVPATNATRTALDLAATADGRELEQIVGEAFARRMTNRARLLALLDRHPRHPGARPLRALLEAGADPARTRSVAEERLLRAIRRANLPAPEVNARWRRWEVDFLWPEHGLAVEVDGYASHSSPSAFHRDRIKAAELQAAGIEVIRVGWPQVEGDLPATVALIAMRLGALRPSGPRGRGGAP